MINENELHPEEIKRVLKNISNRLIAAETRVKQLEKIMQEGEQTNKVTLWLDYGYEGWNPRDFDSMSALLAAIKIGETFGNKFRITKEIQLIGLIDMLEEKK